MEEETEGSGGGGGGGRFGGGSGGQGGSFKNKQPGESLRQPKWDQYSLVPFEKHFYNPHPNLLNADRREVEKFRSDKEINCGQGSRCSQSNLEFS